MNKKFDSHRTNFNLKFLSTHKRLHDEGKYITGNGKSAETSGATTKMLKAGDL